ncbi:unnamed protein product [Cladocopium goreaui]|uniref:Transmembrane protein n=1 Tax=Cladocopium goreaui TaxID=2562237 RepID=A0A9P1BH39_9DINO|nr:unnamed protein product [Cladocopium goreaui]|mmetsp:Transcript_76550/g.169158  ORF Transcript_76550/g.169158 Transcript_76550/m.169158 type:complete len:440 (-) Transcript_76550:118-1437(-)
MASMASIATVAFITGLCLGCLTVSAAPGCDVPQVQRPNGTMNSAPLLLQRPGTLVTMVKPKNRSLHDLPVRDYPPQPNFPRLATETWRFMQLAEGKVRQGTVVLEQFGPAGVHKFFNAALIFDWCLFLVAACVALVWRKSSQLLAPLTSLLGWLALGAIYAVIIFGRMGSHHGSNWVAGYFLELIFLIENVFVFHAIAEAFLVPAKRVVSCLVLVAWGQICFDVVFYMGLAQWLRSWVLLPYLLGLWLLGLGVSVLRHSIDEPEEQSAPSPSASDTSDAAQSPAADMLRNVVGNRVDMDGHSDAGFLVLREKDIKVPILDVVTCVLLLADFLLDIDVVLTKIEEIPNTYIGFSSSALATFLIPELFALSQDMLSCFPLLHYGIGLVLCFFGLEMVLQPLVEVEPLISCAVVVVILAACVVASAVKDHWRCPESGRAGRA